MFVVKFGGSLLDCAKKVTRELVSHAENSGQCLLLMPGGGVFADTVRGVDTRAALSPDTAHWMAVLAMEQYGLLLCDGTGAIPVRSRPEGTGVFVMLPCELLKHTDELSHDWSVTSDTIAAWLAHRYKSSLIKATDVEALYLQGNAVKEVCASRLTGITTCLDPVLPEFLIKHSMDCRVVCGRSSQPIITAIEENHGGTLIKGC